MSELFPTKTIAIEVVGCTDDAKIWEFNYWFDKVRIPEISKIRGIVGIHRYRDMLLDFGDYTPNWSAPKGAPVRHLNLYRINSPDPWGLMQEIKKDNERRAEEDEINFLKVSELTVWEFILYRRTVQPLVRPETHLPDGMPEAFLLVNNSSVPGKELEHDDWWLNTHAHDLMEIPGYVQCSRYRSLNPKPDDNEATTCNIYEIDLDDVRTSVMKNFVDDSNVRRPQGRTSGFTKRGPTTYARGVYQHWDLM
ncbi:hypothetical protein ACFLUU_08130 [Chloroflexota bacterium]